MAKQRKKAKKKKTKKARKKSRGLCFTIMPFGEWFDDYYTDIYIPAIEAAGLKAARADDLYRPSTIVQDIWNYTKEAKLVLVDLTGKNPNVFYELGLAHALAKPAILITNCIDDVPFDLRALRVIEYNKSDYDWGNKLKEKITTAINETLNSPTDAVLPAFIDVKEEDRTQITISKKDFLDLKRDLEMTKNELRSRRHTVGHESMEPGEAGVLLRKYIRMGYPESIVIRKLEMRGVPRFWIEDQMKRLKRRSQSNK